MRDFRTLNVWEKAHQLALAVYAATEPFPPREDEGLAGRLRRSGSAIPAHIAHACGQASDADMAGDLHQALGSASELEYTLLLAHDLQLLPAGDYSTLQENVSEVKRMLTGFLRKVQRAPAIAIHS